MIISWGYHFLHLLYLLPSSANCEGHRTFCFLDSLKEEKNQKTTFPMLDIRVPFRYFIYNQFPPMYLFTYQHRPRRFLLRPLPRHSPRLQEHPRHKLRLPSHSLHKIPPSQTKHRASARHSIQTEGQIPTYHKRGHYSLGKGRRTQLAILNAIYRRTPKSHQP